MADSELRKCIATALMTHKTSISSWPTNLDNPGSYSHPLELPLIAFLHTVPIMHEMLVRANRLISKRSSNVYSGLKDQEYTSLNNLKT